MFFHKDSIHSSLDNTYFILYQDSSMQFHTIPMHTARLMLQETIHACKLDWFMVKFFSWFWVPYATNLDVHLRIYRVFPNSMIEHYYRHTSLICNKPSFKSIQKLQSMVQFKYKLSLLQLNYLFLLIQLNLDDLNNSHRFLAYKTSLHMIDDQFRQLDLIYQASILKNTWIFMIFTPFLQSTTHECT